MTTPAAGRRDRDADGRPRQARPRDSLGRPLPYGSRGVDPLPEVALPPARTLAEVRRRLTAGEPFAAHELCELRWKAGPDAERPLWQGLAQVLAGLTHRARGNDVGAQRLVERGRSSVDAYRASGGEDHGLGDDWLADLTMLGRQRR